MDAKIIYSVEKQQNNRDLNEKLKKNSYFKRDTFGWLVGWLDACLPACQLAHR